MKSWKRNKKITPEKVIVEVVARRKESGEPGVILPVQVIDNVFVDGRSLTVRHVDKLAYQYDRSTFDDVCQQFGLAHEEKEKLKALIFLNSGYVNHKLLREHSVYERQYTFGEVGNHYRELTERLYEARQAVPPPKGRKLYRLASYKKQPGLISKSDVKDVIFLLLLSGLVVGLLALILPLIPSGDKGIDIYTRDEGGNYVLDENGRAITKQEQCYKDRELGAAIGYGDTTGHCTLSGRWVDSE